MTTEEVLLLIEALNNSDIDRLKLKKDDVFLCLERNKKMTREVVSQPIEEEITQKEVKRSEHKVKNIITSPLVGTFYAASDPSQPPFVQIGDSIQKGQTLAIIEAMKLMNELSSEYDGKISAILVKNGDAVQYGQPLFEIE